METGELAFADMIIWIDKRDAFSSTSAVIRDTLVFTSAGEWF